MDDGNTDNRANSVHLELELGLSLAIKVPEMEEWKGPILHSLLQVRAEVFEIKWDDNAADDDEGMHVSGEILANNCTS